MIYYISQEPSRGYCGTIRHHRDPAFREILRYSDMINRKDVSNYSVAELIEFLIHSDEEISWKIVAEYSVSLVDIMS